MKTMTIRGVDESLSKSMREQAQAESISVNQYVLKILREALGLTKALKHTRRYTDLDYLIGSWTEEEFLEFEESQKPFETIDEALWR